ncbi:MAG: ATP-grasp domain-containing protein [Candidatus Omnitrophica bacterium]|nr:ATP-grasp domain-containing protein [Candidatus Omnitrophota bacterium]
MILQHRKKSRILIAIAKEENKRTDITAVSRCKNSIEKVFLKKGIKPETLFLQQKDFKNTESLKARISDINPLYIVNLFEGFSNFPQQEADFVRLLEDLKIPFTGNGSLTLLNCLDKMRTKNILKKNNLPVAPGFFVRNMKQVKTRRVNFPLFIKPCREDGSWGVHNDSVVYDRKELFSVIQKRLRFFPQGLLVEEFLPGKEYSAALIGNSNYKVMGISEIDYSKCHALQKHKRSSCKRHKAVPFLTYEAKWNHRALNYRLTMPDYTPKINRTLRRNIISLSKKAAKALGCRGYFRVDFREAFGKLFVIDINPNPDINNDSGYLRLAYGKGYTYAEIIEKIVQLANYH